MPTSVTAARGVPLYLSWTGLLAAALLLVLSEALPWRLTFLTPDRLHAAVLELQVFLALALAPFLAAGAVHALVLAALGLPFAAAASSVSATPWGGVLLGQVLLVPVAALALEAGARAPRAYAAVLLLLAAAVPLAAFVAAEFAGRSLSALAVVSPFWALAEPLSVPAVVHAGLCAGATAFLVLAPKRPVDVAATSG